MSGFVSCGYLVVESRAYINKYMPRRLLCKASFLAKTCVETAEAVMEFCYKYDLGKARVQQS